MKRKILSIYKQNVKQTKTRKNTKCQNILNVCE